MMNYEDATPNGVDKAQLRAEIAEDTRKYLEAGGKITYCNVFDTAYPDGRDSDGRERKTPGNWRLHSLNAKD